MVPFLTKEDMLDVACCASFMQALKLELWDASVQGALPGEAELDAIAMRLFDEFIAKT